MSIKPSAQFCVNCPRVQAAVGCHGGGTLAPSGPHVWCYSTQGKRKSLCKLLRTGPRTTYNSFSIYLFICFFISILTYFDKGEKQQKKRFLPAAGFVESDCISFHKAEAGAACTVGAAPLLCGRWMMCGDVQLCLVDVMNTITSP